MKGLGADTPYWQSLQDGQLKLQQCSHCSQWHWPAVWRCGECGSWEQQWRPVEARGRIYSWTRSHYDFGAPKGLPLPYVSVVVELEGADRLRLLGHLAEGAQPAIGSPVRGEIFHCEIDGETIPAWRWQPASSSANSAEENSQ